MMKSNSARQKGQTLIELLIAIAIGAILTGSLVALGSSSTRRASASRQSNEATKLSQEGAEILRHIRDANEPGAVQVGGCPSPCSWNDLYALAPFGNSSTSYRIVLNGVGGCPTLEWCLLSGTETGLLDGVFSREINIRDNAQGGPPPTICGDSGPIPKGPEDIKRVHIIVSWSSPIGVQERETISCLTHDR